MGQQTGIEWTDHTFNIAWGCMKVSPGCANCYADTLSRRYGHDVWGPAKTTARRTFGPKHWNDPIRWNRDAEKAGVRRRVFCSSMCDVFEDHPTIDAEREKLWPLIRATPWLDWQLLTKRPERIKANLPDDWNDGYSNVWLGTSVESQPYAWRAFELCNVRAAVHFISAEPLLDRVDLASIEITPREIFNAYEGYVTRDGADGDYLTVGRVRWVIAGGESGAKARPMDLEWARLLRDQCETFEAAYFLKQLGGRVNKRGGDDALLDGWRHTRMPRTA